MVLWKHIICGAQFLEKGGYTFDDTRGYHRIALLDKCHYNFLLPLLWLQFSGIMLSIKRNIFQSIVWCIRLRASTQDFCYYRLGLKPTSYLFTFSKLLYSQHLQTSFHKTQWAQFPLTFHFSHWSVTIWHLHPPYDRSISCPTDHLKRTNTNSSTRKIRLTSVTKSQVVAHKSWVGRCFPSTPVFSCNNLHNFHALNHSHSQCIFTRCSTLKFLILQILEIFLHISLQLWIPCYKSLTTQILIWLRKIFWTCV